MANRELPSPDDMRKLVEYDCETGALTWFPRSAEFFKDGKKSATHACRVWNAKFAGRPAFNGVDSHGYFKGCVNYRMVKAHRVAWVVYHGHWPEGEIDHINGNPLDNRIANLRCVSRSENSRNMPLARTSATGIVGVVKRGNRWIAQIGYNKRNYYLGIFDTCEAAIAARKAKEMEFGFHANHGRRAA